MIYYYQSMNKNLKVMIYAHPLIKFFFKSEKWKLFLGHYSINKAILAINSEYWINNIY